MACTPTAGVSKQIVPNDSLLQVNTSNMHIGEGGGEGG